MDKYLKFNSQREGMIGSIQPYAEILFVLREPHEEKNQGYFWFRDKVYNEKIATNIYYKVLGLLAEMFIKEDKTIHHKVGQCAYMNIYPVSGEATASSSYCELLSCNNKVKYRIENCITNLAPKIIITCKDIYDKLIDIYGKGEPLENHLLYQSDKVQRTFRSTMINFNGSQVLVYEFYHPRARRSFNTRTVKWQISLRKT